MNASTFNSLIIGLLCLAVTGLGAGLHNQHQRVVELQSRVGAQLLLLEALQADANALQDAQEQLQRELRELRLTVDSGEQQANTLDPLLEQWAQEIQALRDGLAARANAADLTALSARLEQAEQQLVALASKPPSPPSAPSAATAKKPARPRDRLRPRRLSRCWVASRAVVSAFCYWRPRAAARSRMFGCCTAASGLGPGT